ncbi:MAG: hypothetical protein JNL83_31775 [Myxococcales bacterium]|nr:hypothetical protein [Myxococcales bacterium]
MKRLVTTIVLAFAAAPASIAYADAPTKEQIEAAKQAFTEGDALYRAGKFEEAILKLRESYRLSQNPVLLYNIGYIEEQAGHEDRALFYYKKFLTDAPKGAPRLDEAMERVAALEKEGVKASADPDAPVAPTANPPPPPPPTAKIEHQLVWAVPPGLPVDIVAAVPPADHVLTVSYRTAGEATFTVLPMFTRNDKQVARIPAARVLSGTVQYYLELKGPDGKLVARMGRGTAPNLINIEANAKPVYDATMADDGTDAPPAAPERVPLPPPPPPPGSGPKPPEPPDPARFATIKWISTGVAGGLLGASIVSYIIAGIQHDKLVTDSKSCGVPPCRQFDQEHDQKLEDLGERYDTIFKVTLVAGVAVSGVAGYFWYRDVKAKREHRSKVSVVPSVGSGFAGLTAVGSF